jgi:hypothetical protein
MYKGGGNVQQTYGLRNAAEQIRERGRGDDTILAHINPQEAGILKLLGGSGTINPYTGLPEFGFFDFVQDIPIVGKPLYETGSRIGKGIESGVEGVAKALGPVGQIAAAYFGGPIGAALYAGLAPPGSSFDTKSAIRAGAMTYGANALSGASNPMAPRFDYSNAFGSGMEYAPMGETISMAGPGGFEGAASDAATSYLNPPPTVDPSSFATGPQIVDPGVASALERGVEISQIPAIGAEGASMSNLPYTPPTPDMSGFEGGITERGGSYTPDYNLPPVVDRSTPLTDYSGVRGLDPAGENFLGAAGSLAEGAYDLAASNPLTTAALGVTAYGAYKTKQEIDAAKAEADRILADQANRTKEEIEFAQSVLRDYPIEFRRLTEEDIRRERGKAMGGRITSYDDEPGMDDGMMQGGIAALAKGGLPPRYLRGGGDGMSDSIRARIEGKQEARLADGEFVVPADVVSHLGNGSSNAGAKKLYAMMDRVRRSRTGKTRQAPEVNTRSLMPA